MLKTTLALGLTAALAAASLPFLTADEADYTVHEWGTFTSIAGEDGNAVQWLPIDGPVDLPCFVEEGQGIPPKTSLRATVRMETPVLYFYADQRVAVDVRVRFRDGLLTEFYPSAVSSRDQLTWRDVEVTPGLDPAFPTESTPNHYYAARETDAAPLRIGAQHEKFLFYRGVGGVHLPLEATVAADGMIAAVNTSDDAIPAAVLFERRGAQLGFRALGALSGSATLEPVALDDDEASLRAVLEEILVAQGLYPREAAAMVETWSGSWFEEGTRLFYIVPKPLIDRALPLDIRPAPAAVERVFVGRLELVTPAVLEDLRDKLDRGDAAGLAARGRFLRAFGQRLFASPMRGDERARLSAALERALSELTAGATRGPCNAPTSH